MKICIVSNYKKNGYGESTRPYYLSRNLLKLGHKILHLCDYAGHEDGIEYIKIDPWGWEPSLIKRLAGFVRLSSRVRLFNPDIVYMHQFNTARWALASRSMTGKKFVFDAHTSVNFEMLHSGPHPADHVERVTSEEKQICRDSDYIICASEETRDILKATYNLEKSKLFVVGNATNIQPVTETEVAAVNNIKHNLLTCVATLPFDGFFSNELALAYLFKIAALVYAQNDRIRFVVLGGGEKPIPPTPNVIYKGYVPDLRKEILDADICLMPYPANAVCGGARNKFCDFIALGKVVVSSNEGMRGMQALTKDKNCIVADNEFDFAGEIISLSESPEKIKKMEIEVMKVKNLFGWKDRAQQVSEIFEKILLT